MRIYSYCILVDDDVDSIPPSEGLSEADELLLRSHASTLDAILSGSVTSSEHAETMELEDVDPPPRILDNSGNPPILSGLTCVIDLNAKEIIRFFMPALP